MEDWFEVKKKDIIAVLDKRKDCFPWGDHPDEKYSCLVFWEDGAIRMTVDMFDKLDSDTYECLRWYTTFIGNTLDDYKNMTEEQLAAKAYSAWCSGAR